MKITLYTNKSDKIKLNKSIEKIGEYSNIILKDNVTIEEPIIILKTSLNLEKLSHLNYCYIDDFKRYYYVDVELIGENLIKLNCKVDSLMSYKNEIKNLTTLIERQENTFSNFIVDNELPIACGREVHTIHVGGFGDTLNYILCVNGGSV